jgi:hypothetical protein
MIDATLSLPLDLDSGATFDARRHYRYRLWRSWGTGRRCVFVGLNPSTADETKDDPTIRKCMGFARRWGFGVLEMVNLFAWRCTDPEHLPDAAPEHVGPDNDAALADAFDGAHRIVWAWGRHSPPVQRLVRARIESGPWRLLRTRCQTGTLGRAQDGSPRHPLRLAYDTQWVPDGGSP